MQHHTKERRLLVVLAFIIASYTTATAQQGEYHFGSVNRDSTLQAQIVVGWDYVRVTTIASLVGGVSFSEAYASTPNFNFSFGDWDHFWISHSSSKIKFLGKFSINKKRFVFIRINKNEYRE